VWNLVTQGEEYGLWVLEKKVLRRIFGFMKEEVAGIGEDCIMTSFIIHLVQNRVQ